MSKKLVYYEMLADGSMRLYGRESDYLGNHNSAIYWDDFVRAMVAFGLRVSPRAVQPMTIAQTTAVLEERLGKTAVYALSELYGRQMTVAAPAKIVGRIIQFDQPHGYQSIVVMSIITTAFIRAHRLFTDYIAFNDHSACGFYNTGTALLWRVTSAVRGLGLEADEEHCLLSFYQNMLATI